jgi:hypothetical protein
MKSRKSQYFNLSSNTGEKPMSHSEGSQARGILLLGEETAFFIVFRPSTGWMMATHTKKREIYFT